MHKKSPDGFAPILIVLVIAIALAGAYILLSKNVNNATQNLSSTSPSPSSTSDESKIPSETNNPTVKIPSDWKKFTATDSGFGTKTTLSLPPGFSFSFTGSESIIQNDSDASELWSHLTSITTDDNGKLINTYTGGSRRNWYEKYFIQINGAGSGLIKGFEERTTNGVSYLIVKVENQLYKIEDHYLYLKGDIVNVIKPSSEVAYTSKAVIPGYIPTILYSLQVTKIK